MVVAQDASGIAQCWTRIYHGEGALPQVIRSTKRFAGPTGLEECVGAGIGMALALSVEQRALAFRSTEYFWRCGRLRIRIPDCLECPGASPSSIARSARVASVLRCAWRPWFGELIRQVAFFRDTL